MASRNALASAAALAAIMAAPAPAKRLPPGPNWVTVGRHDDGGPVEVDTRSIAPWGDLVQGWWRVTLATPRADGTVVEKHHDAIDCARGASTALEQVELSVDGTVVNATRETPGAAITRLAPATPGTTGEMAVRALCRLRPPSPRPDRPR
jgi:hypothetical protein